MELRPGAASAGYWRPWETTFPLRESHGHHSFIRGMAFLRGGAQADPNLPAPDQRLLPEWMLAPHPDATAVLPSVPGQYADPTATPWEKGIYRRDPPLV